MITAAALAIKLGPTIEEAARAAHATIQNELATLKRMFTLAVQAGRLRARPHVPSVRVSNARQDFFEKVDFRAVLKELDHDPRPASPSPRPSHISP